MKHSKHYRSTIIKRVLLLTLFMIATTGIAHGASIQYALTSTYHMGASGTFTLDDAITANPTRFLSWDLDFSGVAFDSTSDVGSSSYCVGGTCELSTTEATETYWLGTLQIWSTGVVDALVWYPGDANDKGYIGDFAPVPDPAPPINQPPSVSAGSDQAFPFPNFAFLDGTVSDDGLPSGTLTTMWSKVSGAGTVTFTNPNVVDTTATFGQAGTYTLRLTANDGLLQASADVVITVNAATPGEATLYDLNGDGKADLVWRNTSDGAVGVWLMSGLTRGPTDIPGGAPTNWVIAGIGDVNDDGKADLIWRNTSTGDVGVWLMDGVNALTKDVIKTSVPLEWVIAGVGDLNDDEKADLIWRNTRSGVVAAWLLDGLNPPTTRVYGGRPAKTWTIAAVGDINDDDKADLVWRNTADGSVAAWLMDGLNPPTKGLIPGTPSAAWVIAGIGDLNDDDKADLVWRSTTTGDVAGWLMDGFNAPTKGLIKAGVPLAWVIENVADLDGDEKADLVWRNTSDGSVAGWLMDGLSPLTKDLITGSVPLEWEIQR
jgi:hypothetical protein